jgi:hypothetical protein
MLTRIFAAALLLTGTGAACASESIGAAIGLTPAATGSMAGALSLGKAVFRDETVRTGANGSAELRFLDDTHLGLGPSSSVILDKFVYGGGGSADQVAIKLTKGAFRFVTGNAPKKAYRIETPLAVIGLRGTTLDIVVAGGVVKVTLREGAADVCPTGATCVPLEQINETFTILADGTIQRGTGTRPFAIFCRLLDARESEICQRSASAPEPLEVAPDAGGGSDNASGNPPSGPGRPARVPD